MKRNDCLKVLAKHRKNDLVIACWQSINAWEQVSPSKFNFHSMRTMGDCSTFALGLAMARPDKKVIVLEGDGSLCMSLFSLVTIAEASPPNFYQFIMYNKIYETTGGQSIPNIDNLDLALIAGGAGISKIYRYRDAQTFESKIADIFKERGPVFVILDIEPDETHCSGKEFIRVRALDREYIKRFKEALLEQ